MPPQHSLCIPEAVSGMQNNCIRILRKSINFYITFIKASQTAGDYLKVVDSCNYAASGNVVPSATVFFDSKRRDYSNNCVSYMCDLKKIRLKLQYYLRRFSYL